MLVLTRRKGQRIMIGDDIEIKVNRVHRGQVKLGITAPNDMPVHREEIKERIEFNLKRKGGNVDACYNI